MMRNRQTLYLIALLYNSLLVAPLVFAQSGSGATSRGEPGAGGRGGGEPSVVNEVMLRQLLEDGPNFSLLKISLINYLRTLALHQVEDLSVRRTLMDAGGLDALIADIRTSRYELNQGDCRDAYNNKVPASARIGDRGGPICFDIPALAAEFRILNTEEAMIRLAALAIHEHRHHLQQDPGGDQEKLARLEDEAYRLAAYVRLTARGAQTPILRWVPLGTPSQSTTAVKTCPEMIKRDYLDGVDKLVESDLPRITVREAARRVVAGGRVARLRTARGYCLRIYRHGHDGAAEGAAYVENTSPEEIAREVRANIAARSYQFRNTNIEIGWQYVSANDDSRLNLNESEYLDQMWDLVFKGRENDPLLNSYAIVDTREIFPLSVFGPILSYRYGGGVYFIDDSYAPRPVPNEGYENWNDFVSSGYGYLTLDSSHVDPGQLYYGQLVDFFPIEPVLEQLRNSERVAGLLNEAIRPLLPRVENLEQFSLIMDSVIGRRNSWPGILAGDGCYGICNYAIRGYDPATNVATIVVAIRTRNGYLRETVKVEPLPKEDTKEWLRSAAANWPYHFNMGRLAPRFEFDYTEVHSDYPLISSRR